MNDQHSRIRSGDIIPLPAFRDNYIWLIRRNGFAAVVDPGEAAAVEHALQEHGLRLSAILLTHHHDDHIGGVAELVGRHRCEAYGPTGAGISGLTRELDEGSEVELTDLDLRFDVLAIPGHTTTHIAYVAPGVLFPGDTLFSAGCGRLFGGTPAQMHASLQRLAALPADTAVYPAHEYTLANLAFARAAEPDNPERDRYLDECEQARAVGRPTLPTSIGQEKLINPFLRTDSESVLATIAGRDGGRPRDGEQCFTALRAWKDVF